MPKPKTDERRHYQGSLDSVIHVVVQTNPKKLGSKTRKRFDLYRDGMTVGNYVASCKVNGVPRAEDALLDITWDWARGFIEVIEK